MPKYINKAFSPRRMRLLEPRIRQLAHQLIDGFADYGRVDLISQFAYPLPAFIIFALCGFPDKDADLLKSWSSDRLLFLWGNPSAAQQAECAHNLVNSWRYCENHVRQRLEEPQDDFTSDLIRARAGDDSALSIPEITSIVLDWALLDMNLQRHLLGIFCDSY